jgi:hypothetical protein
MTLSFEYLHLCHISKKEMVILKLDSEKSFDKVEHEVIIQVLRYRGFLARWINWIKEILKSGNSPQWDIRKSVSLQERG